MPSEHPLDRLGESGHLPAPNECQLRLCIFPDVGESGGEPSDKEERALEREKPNEVDQLLERRYVEPKLLLVQRTGELVCRRRQCVDDG